MYISYLPIGEVYIYPHCVLSNTILDLDITSKDILDEFKILSPDIYIVIWDQNTFCSEVYGDWNRVISISNDGCNYNYMIRKDKHFNSTFGCPFFNKEYPKEYPLTQDNIGSEIFLNFEKSVLKVMGKTTILTSQFPI